MNYPEGVRRVDDIDEGGLLVCLSKPVDLDDLMIFIVTYAQEGYWDGGWVDEGLWSDDPTRTPLDGRVEVGWYRKIPCQDGQHVWDLWPVDGPGPGVFLGVYAS